MLNISLLFVLIIQISIFQPQTKEKVLVEEESSKKRVETVMKNLSPALAHISQLITGKLSLLGLKKQLSVGQLSVVVYGQVDMNTNKW